MRIRWVEIKNFRCLRDVRLECSDLTAILGRNGTGKSTVLYALEQFYNLKSNISVEDFHGKDLENPIEIRVAFRDLNPQEQREFAGYLEGGDLVVTKRIRFEEDRFVSRYFGSSKQFQLFASVRSETQKSRRKDAFNTLVADGGVPGLSGKAKSAEDADRLMVAFESAHPELLELVEREEQFLGPTNVGGGKLDKYTKYVLVPAVKDASDEATGKRGAVLQLIDLVVLRQVNARQDVQEFKRSFREQAERIYSSGNLHELPALGSEISRVLGRYAPGAELKLTWDQVKPLEVPLPNTIAKLVEDDFESDIHRKGHGLQRSLILTLLQYLATSRPPKISTGEDSLADDLPEAEAEQEDSEDPDLVLAIEEPELYQHPSRCRFLSRLLVELSGSPGEAVDSRTQVIYVSHSPYFFDLDRFESVRICRKPSLQPAGLPQSRMSRFSLQAAARELARIADRDPGSFSVPGFRARAKPVVNVLVSEGFFAEAVVLVEGESERGFLSELQQIRGKEWERLGIVIVPVGGKNNLDRPAVIFRGLEIPTYVIFDGDSSHRGNEKLEPETIKRNRACLRLVAGTVEDFPSTTIQSRWAAFSDNIEAEVKAAIGEAEFERLRGETAREFGYDRPTDALKNPEGAGRFLGMVYDAGHRVAMLEGIVDSITALVESSP